MKQDAKGGYISQYSWWRHCFKNIWSYFFRNHTVHTFYKDVIGIYHKFGNFLYFLPTSEDSIEKKIIATNCFSIIWKVFVTFYILCKFQLLSVIFKNIRLYPPIPLTHITKSIPNRLKQQQLLQRFHFTKIIW